MILSSGTQSIDIFIVGYEFPKKTISEKEFDYDANWLRIGLHYTDENADEIYTLPCLLTDEFSDMIKALQNIADGKEDRYKSAFTEPDLSAEIAKADGGIDFALAFRQIMPNGRVQQKSVAAKWTMAEAKIRLKELKDMESQFPKR